MRRRSQNLEAPLCFSGGMTTINRRLASATTGQLGAFTREQAHELGVSDDQLRSRVKSGFLVQTGPNVYRMNGPGPSPKTQLRQLLADVGGLAVASRFTAAALHGFDGYGLVPPFDLTIHRDRQVRRYPHRIHTATSLDVIDRGEVDGVAVTRPARTLIDLARHEAVEQLVIAVDSALRDRLVTERSLHRRIVALRRQGMHGIPRLIDAVEGAEVARGAHSWLEREFLRLVAAAGLPAPTPQVVLTRANGRLVRVDFHFPGTNVVVEVLGYRWHRSPSSLRRDAERLNALLDRGVRPYQFTYSQVVEAPVEVIDGVRRALGM